MIHTHEIYSIDQRRAKIDYQFNYQAPDEVVRLVPAGTFHLDTKENLALLATKSVCKKIDRADFEELLGLNLPESLKLDSNYDFVVGTARMVLFSFDKVTKQKILSNGVASLQRNHESIKYTLEYGGVTIDFEYSKASLDRDEKFLIPLSAAIQTGPNQLITFVYSDLELLVADVQKPMITRGPAVIDPLSFKLADGCYGALLTMYSKDELFSDKEVEDVRFSFETLLEQSMQDQSMVTLITKEQFVAYDSMVDSLRIDSKTNQKLYPPQHSQVFNFRTNRVYDIVEGISDGQDDETSSTSILNLNTDDNDADGLKRYLAECTSSQAYNFGKSKGERAFTFRQLLVGDNKFVYMGKARIRGIDARIYESEINTLPFWIDQAVPVTEREENSVRETMRKPGAVVYDKELDTGYTLLVYVSDYDSNQALLMVEIIGHNKDRNEVSRKFVSVFDFTWDLKEAPDGDRVTELFSLEDVCSNNLGQNRYSLYEFLMSLDTKRAPILSEYMLAKLNNKISRNLAILSELQNQVRIPLNMIFDLQSRLVESDAKNQKTVSVSFRLAEHLMTESKLFYKGRGKTNNRSDHLKVIRNINFAHCFALNSHLKQKQLKVLIFGYDPIEGHCYIDMSFKRNGHKYEALIDDKSGPIEIYRIEFIKNLDYYSLNTKTKTREIHMMGNELYLFNTKFDDQPEVNSKSLKFVVGRFQVHRDDKRIALAKIDGDKTDEDAVIEKVVGFGLVEEASITRQIKPAIIRGEQSMMNYDQCHAACISDFDCESFSICIKDLEVTCRVSKRSFKSARVIKELLDISEKSKAEIIKKETKITISLDNSQGNAELIKHPNCMLYNKNFLDLFEKSELIARKIKDRLVYPVMNKEECASMCVKTNIQAIQRYLRQEEETVKMIKEDPLDETILMQLLKIHKDASDNRCGAIFYTEKSTVANDEQMNFIMSRVPKELIADGRADYDGLCLTNYHLRKPEQELLEKYHLDVNTAENKNWPNPEIMFERFAFNTAFFYEKKHGYRLKPSTMSPLEEAAYKTISNPFVSDQDPIDPASYNLMKNFVERQENAQYTMMVPEIDCAGYCFGHSWYTWPACRSFEMVYTFRNGLYVHECILNTITYQQAIERNRTDLIEYGAHVWHYEPRAGFISDALELESKNQLFGGRFLFKYSTDSGSFKIYTFGTLALVVLGAICGVLIGMRLSRRAGDWLPANRFRSQSVAGLMHVPEL